MNTKWLAFIIMASAAMLFLLPSTVYSQKMTRVRGVVIDANTKEPLPFVTIGFVGKNIGTITDYDGSYSIETQWASDKIQASYLGYSNIVENITIGKRNVIDFQMESENINLNEIVITGKKKRYKNKNNPAVELIRKVVKNKSLNRKENLSFYEYDKYEKVEFDLNNITDKFKNRKAFNKFQFIFDYVDTSEINGKPYLPVFLKETLSKRYYRKSPKDEKEYISGSKMIGLPGFMDTEGVSVILENIYQDIDIYDNNIMLLTNQFVSPISTLAPMLYKFHIMDTLMVNGYDCIKLAYQPRNKADLAFKGNLYITNDDRYAVIKADLRITEDISLNYIKDLVIVQEFEYINGKSWMLAKDELVVDINVGKKGVGLFGKKTVQYDNYIFDEERDAQIYSGTEYTIKEEGYDKRDDDFWVENRLVELSEQEKNIYVMTDNIQDMPAFRRAVDVLMLVASGYWNMGKVDLGSIFTFYSFNEVEGTRLKIGGKTSEQFSERLRLDGYLLYGLKDKQFKYSGSALWSLNNKPLTEKPKHTIMAMYQVETNFPGMELQFVNEDNFILSFKRGVADKILYYKMYKIEHYRDWGNGLSSTLNFKNVEQKPGGTLTFEVGDYFIDNITSTEVGATLRFAPNEKFYQGVSFKTPLITKYPIFQLSYTQGIKGLFNADYDYRKLKFSGFKRFNVAPLGFTKVEVEAGKVFGKGVPFPLLYVHRANQTYAYQLHSYNMMNFLEFVSDKYVSLSVEHQFYGFFFNRIPLLKHLKLREIITFKGIYGGISDGNNPGVTSGFIKFPVGEDGAPSTFTLKDKPYIEMSIGIGNIFKFLRIDLIKRVTYLDNPNVSKLGIRGRIVLDF